MVEAQIQRYRKILERDPTKQSRTLTKQDLTEIYPELQCLFIEPNVGQTQLTQRRNEIAKQILQQNLDSEVLKEIDPKLILNLNKSIIEIC